jgi:hypothetical protein
MSDYRLPILINLRAPDLTPFWRTQNQLLDVQRLSRHGTSLKYSYGRLPMDQASFSLFTEQNVAVFPMSKSFSASINATSRQVPFAARMMSSERNGQDRSGSASNGDQDKEPTGQAPQSFLHNNDASEDVT